MRGDAVHKTGGFVVFGAALASVALFACLSGSPPLGASSDDAGSFVLDDAAPPSTADGSQTVDAARADGAALDGDAQTSETDGALADAAPSCGTNNGACPANSTCSVDTGAVVCTCFAGYAGSACASDCLTANGGCDPNASCTNGDAGVLCACNPGYVGTGATCASLCLTAHGGCDPNATCSNGASGVVCACNPGYTGTGFACASDDYTEWPAPPDSPLEAQYATSSDGTIVIDRATGLVWQRQLYASPCPGDDSTGNGCTYADAQTYCTSLNATGLGGLSAGWRLPSLVELVSIVNYTDGTPSIDTALFPGTPLSTFWSNTLYALGAGNAWGVSFSNGDDTIIASSAVENVRCVNSSAPGSTSSTCGLIGQTCCYAESCQPDAKCAGGACIRDIDFAQGPPSTDFPPEAAYAVSSDGSIVHDSATGLYWQRNVPPSPCPNDGAGVCTMGDAAAYCQTLNAAGLGGITSAWRLPSIGELVSIVNYGLPPPLVDTAIFGNTPTVQFWTSTAYAQGAGNGWAVPFSSGQVGPVAVGTGLAVRCVSTAAPTTTTTCGRAGKPCCYANGCGSELTCSAGTCITDVAFAQTPVETDFPKETAFSVSSDGTIVTDLTSGLYWQRDVFANPCPNDGAGVCTWTDAAAYCAALDANQLGGITSGWRLPSLVELVGIQNYSTPSTTLDTAIFPPIQTGAFWTSTPYALAAANAWAVSTANGTDQVTGVSSALGVRCVSAIAPSASPAGCGLSGDACCYAQSCGAQLACGAASTCELDTNWAQTITTDTVLESGYTLSPGGSVVTDKGTGLVWQRQLEAAPCSGDAGTAGCSWTDAATYCTDMNARALGGYSSGWRVPSIHELVSIVNYSNVISAPNIDLAVFPGTPQAALWTSTPYAQGAGNSLIVDFANGLVGAQTVGTLSAVRCVNPAVVPPAPEGCGAIGQACCTTAACAAALTCASGACVPDTEYSLWVCPPDAPPTGEYAALGGVITDSVTALKWAPQGGTATWSAAATQCAALDATLGNIGWRLPTLVELTSIVNFGAGSAPLVSSAFTTVTASTYWTASPFAQGAGNAWAISFTNGVNSAVATATALNVICVSSN